MSLSFILSLSAIMCTILYIALLYYNIRRAAAWQSECLINVQMSNDIENVKDTTFVTHNVFMSRYFFLGFGSSGGVFDLMLSNTISLVVMYSYTGLVSSSSSSTGLLFFGQITMTATPLTNPISSKTKNNTAASIQGVLVHSVDFVVVVLTSVVDSSVTDEFRDNLS